MPWAMARAPRTALAEQHERSASFSGSRHSSSVTATASRGALQQGGDGAVDAAAHRHQRALGSIGGAARVGGAPRAPSARRSASAASSAACSLPGSGRPSASAIACGAHARGVEDARAAHELDRGAAGRERRAAARRLEAGVGHAVAVDGDADAHEVAARGAAGGAVMRRGHVAAADGMAQVLLEALVGHPASVGRAVASISSLA